MIRARRVLENLILGIALLLGQAGHAGAEEAREDARESLTSVDGISIHANEEEPRVLHIVPWQPPTLVRRDHKDLMLPEAEKVLEPIDVEAFRTHRQFRRTLEVLDVDRSGP